MCSCLLLAHPFLEMGFLDDWSYIKTAQVFAHTGRLVYNGWATATLGWQVLWGALFSRLFGFSFAHVRLSTLPVAMASVYLFHQILIRFGISRGSAIFGSLSLALSPPFFAMSATYMTDVPGVFCTLLCLYFCQRAISLTADRAALAWLCLAAVTNVSGGTVRQTAWLGALVILPSAVWLLRRRPAVLWGGTLLWVISAAGVFALMHWFNQQPYFLPPRIPVYLLLPPALARTLLREAAHAVMALLSTLLLLLPVLVAWWPGARSAAKRRMILVLAIWPVLVTIFLNTSGAHRILDYLLAPWLPGVLEYIATGYTVMPGSRPASLGYWQRTIITVLVLGSALVFVLHLYGARRRGQFTKNGSGAWPQVFGLTFPRDNTRPHNRRHYRKIRTRISKSESRLSRRHATPLRHEEKLSCDPFFSGKKAAKQDSENRWLSQLANPDILGPNAVGLSGMRRTRQFLRRNLPRTGMADFTPEA